MLSDNFFSKFINKKEKEKKMNNKPSKEEAKQELIEKFGMDNTWSFQWALRRGEIELAENWLNYIIENKENFPQYEGNWDEWLKDRQENISTYKELKANGTLEKTETKTIKSVSEEGLKRFGITDTKDFRRCLQEGKIDSAQSWFEYVQENIIYFTQYSTKKWLSDRQKELADAKNKG